MGAIRLGDKYDSDECDSIADRVDHDDGNTECIISGTDILCGI